MTKPSKVLVVDDDAATRRLMLSALTCAGLGAVVADNALEGIRALKAQSPDVILLDLSLPGCSGETAAESLREDPRYREIPLILVSGHPDLPKIARETGATDFLKKPFNPAEMVRRVQRAIGNAAKTA